jgi:FKBP-type peptidyl-prolyl cis-trans isomerase FkpA
MRQKRKLTIIGSISAVLIIILVAGALVWHDHHHKKQVADAKQTVGNHTVSLNQLSSGSGDSGGLSVSGQADSLGQLNGSDKQAQGSSSGSSSSSGSVDPATFSKYDNYQSSQNALFGDIQVGSGSSLAVGQKANIYYKVWLTNGTLVDQSPVSSSGQPQPFSFVLGQHQVILGLEQGVAGMKVGGQRLVIVPPTVGYGAQGQGTIPANAVLVFDVQLVSAQ